MERWENLARQNGISLSKFICETVELHLDGEQARPRSDMTKELFHRLGPKNTEPNILGRAYEYLLRKFAEGQGQSAGEFYTPKEVGDLIAELIDPGEYTTIYDPACGSGGC